MMDGDRRRRGRSACLVAALLVCAACGRGDGIVDGLPSADPHSFSRPEQVVVEHIELDLDVDFEARVLRGRATLTIANPAGAGELWLDSHELRIDRVLLGDGPEEARFELGETDEILGRPLVIDIAPDTKQVHIDYATDPGATALQWLEPEQTAGGRHPFLLSQSEAILARSWIPCQDSPGVRVTYGATLRVPEGVTALMSAVNPPGRSADGSFRFEMPHPIPPYLMAIVVGELGFRPLGERTGVWAELPLVEAAAYEFAEAERMLEAAEALYGPYRWGRYDLVVLPPSFPWGGMENPRLTFVTPTLIAGDRSLVSTLAHEIAHSWSGNLVAAATWGDLWLNEGLTNYIERRVVESVRGRSYSELVAAVDGGVLRLALNELGADSPDTHLRLDLAGRDPEDSFGDVAYEKGYLFFRMLEESVGRDRWDRFLRGYFDDHAFSSVGTDEFLEYLRLRLSSADPDPGAVEAAWQLERWIDAPGLPDNAPLIDDSALRSVEQSLSDWGRGAAAATLDTEAWTTHHWLHFLRSLPSELSLEKLEELDETFGLSGRGNAALLQAWLLQSIGRGHEPAELALESFLPRVGRLIFIEPLYERLAATPAGLGRAREIYAGARPGYHALTRRAIEALLAPPPVD